METSLSEWKRHFQNSKIIKLTIQFCVKLIIFLDFTPKLQKHLCEREKCLSRLVHRTNDQSEIKAVYVYIQIDNRGGQMLKTSVWALLNVRKRCQKWDHLLYVHKNRVADNRDAWISSFVILNVYSFDITEANMRGGFIYIVDSQMHLLQSDTSAVIFLFFSPHR